MRVDIWSDLVCPWCYIGKSRFEKGLAAFGHRDEVQVTYHSFELDPESPRGQTTRALDMLVNKFGMSRSDARAGEERLAGMAAEEGLSFHADRPHGNTFDAHRVLHLAAERGRYAETLAHLYRTLWEEGESVFDADALVRPAAEAGLDSAEVRQVLAGDRYADAVRADERQASELGITGVPFYVLDGKYGLSGAQPAEVFTSALEQAFENAGSEASPQG